MQVVLIHQQTILAIVLKILANHSYKFFAGTFQYNFDWLNGRFQIVDAQCVSQSHSRVGCITGGHQNSGAINQHDLLIQCHFLHRSEIIFKKLIRNCKMNRINKLVISLGDTGDCTDIAGSATFQTVDYTTLSNIQHCRKKHNYSFRIHWELNKKINLPTTPTRMAVFSPLLRE